MSEVARLGSAFKTESTRLISTGAREGHRQLRFSVDGRVRAGRKYSECGALNEINKQINKTEGNERQNNGLVGGVDK